MNNIIIRNIEINNTFNNISYIKLKKNEWGYQKIVKKLIWEKIYTDNKIYKQKHKISYIKS